MKLMFKTSDKMKNLLQIAKEKKSKLESMPTVKLTACKSLDGIVVISHNGSVIPSSDLQKFENGQAFVSGLFASKMVGVMVACFQNKIIA